MLLPCCEPALCCEAAAVNLFPNPSKDLLCSPARPTSHLQSWRGVHEAPSFPSKQAAGGVLGLLNFIWKSGGGRMQQATMA